MQVNFIFNSLSNGTSAIIMASYFNVSLSSWRQSTLI